MLGKHGDTTIRFFKIWNIAFLPRRKFEDFARLNKEPGNRPLNSTEIKNFMTRLGLRLICAINLKVEGPLLMERSLVIRSIASFEYRKGFEFLDPKKSKKKTKDLDRLLRQLNKYSFVSKPFYEFGQKVQMSI